MNTGARRSPGAAGDVHVLTIDRVRFGDFEFDRLNRLLYRDGAELSLPPRAVGVLSCLIDRPGQIVPKQVLLDEVWKDANVTETSLTEAVSLLRQALVDDPQRPTFIQTVPRRGYRFVATAHPANGAASPAPAAPPPSPGTANGPAARPYVAAGVSAAASTDAAAALRTLSGSLTDVGGMPGAPDIARDDALAADRRPLGEESAWPAWLPWMFVVAMVGVMSAHHRRGDSSAFELRASRRALRHRAAGRRGAGARRRVAGVVARRPPRGVRRAAAAPRSPARAAGVERADAAVVSAARIYVRDADRLDPDRPRRHRRGVVTLLLAGRALDRILRGRRVEEGAGRRRADRHAV